MSLKPESETTEREPDEADVERISERAHMMHHAWERSRSGVGHQGPRKEYQIEYWIIKAMLESGYVRT